MNVIIGAYLTDNDRSMVYDSPLIIKPDIVSVRSDTKGYYVHISQGATIVEIRSTDGSALTKAEADEIVSNIYSSEHFDLRQRGLALFDYCDLDFVSII